MSISTSPPSLWLSFPRRTRILLAAVGAAVLRPAHAMPPRLFGFSPIMVDQIYSGSMPNLPHLMAQFHLQPNTGMPVENPRGLLTRLNAMVRVSRGKMSRETAVGGGGLNVMRMYAALFRAEFEHMAHDTTVSLLASLGQDSEGATVLDTLAQEKINCDYVKKVTQDATGHVMVIVDGLQRTMVPVQGANLVLPVEGRRELLKIMDSSLVPPKERSRFTGAPPAPQVVFIDGHAIALAADGARGGSGKWNALDVVTGMATWATAGGHYAVLSLAAEYVIGKHRPFIEDLLPKISIVFGNASEFAILLGAGELTDKAMALGVLNAMESESRLIKMAIVTHDSRPVHVAYRFRGTVKVATIQPPKPKIFTDSTAAGDSFAGAFLFGLFKNGSTFAAQHTVDTAVHRALIHGVRAAGNVVGHIGFRYDVREIRGRTSLLKQEDRYAVELEQIGGQRREQKHRGTRGSRGRGRIMGGGSA